MTLEFTVVVYSNTCLRGSLTDLSYFSNCVLEGQQETLVWGDGSTRNLIKKDPFEINGTLILLTYRKRRQFSELRFLHLLNLSRTIKLG